jgi:hypothetical protein
MKSEMRALADGIYLYQLAKDQLREVLKIIRSMAPKPVCDRKAAADLAFRIGYLDGKVVNRAVITLRGPGCSWGRSGMGCTMCGHYAGMLAQQPVCVGDLKEQFDRCMDRIRFEGTPILCVYDGGSFLNPREVSYEVQEYICKTVARTRGIHKFVIETRSEYCDPDWLKSLNKLLGDKSLVVALGLETRNDDVRDLLVNKGMTLDQFEAAADVVKSICGLRVYAMIKPPFLTEAEMIEDAVETIRYVDDLGAEEIHFEPVTVQQHTLMYYLWRQGLYRLPWLWSIIEILKRVSPIKVYCSPFAHYPRPIAKPHNCPGCDSVVLERLLVGYNSTFDVGCLEGLSCRCQEAWHAVLEVSDSRSLQERVLDSIRSTRHFVLRSREIKADLLALEESHFGPPSNFDRGQL